MHAINFKDTGYIANQKQETVLNKKVFKDMFFLVVVF